MRSYKMVLMDRKLEILTEDGFKPFRGFISQGTQKLLRFVLSNGKEIKVTKDHQFRLPDIGNEDNFVEAIFLGVGDELYGGVTVVAVYDDDDSSEVFDAFDVEDTHSYMTNGVVSHNCSLLMLDEFAFLPSGVADEFIASVFPTLSSSEESKMVIVSTPNGVNSFHKIWKEAEEGINGFVNVRGYWDEIHTQEWADEQRKLLGDVRFASEVECVFHGSSHTLVDGKKVATIPYKKPIGEQRGLHYFERPQKDHEYVITVDVSRGRGLDYSAFIVYDITQMPFRVVATFKDNKISPIDYPILISEVGKLYNEAMVLIESNDIGESIANEMWYNLEYPNVLWTDRGKISSHGILGVRTTKSVKRTGCSCVKELIEGDQLILNDHRILEELAGYVLKKGSYSAQDTNINDDLCSCLFLFGWLSDQEYFKALTDMNINSVLGTKFREEVEEYIPMCFFDDGSSAFNNVGLSEDERAMLMS